MDAATMDGTPSQFNRFRRALSLSLSLIIITSNSTGKQVRTSPAASQGSGKRSGFPLGPRKRLATLQVQALVKSIAN